MTAPNIVDVNAIKGESSVKTTLSTSSSTIVFNQVDSNQVYKINSVVVTNVDGTNAADATVEFSRQGQKTSIVKTVSVPADASLVVMSKETGVYLEEGDAITAYASANGDLDISCSYETIAETANTLVTRGLVLYLDAADLNSYDASSANTTWYDLSPGANHGTATTISTATDVTAGTVLDYNTSTQITVNLTPNLNHEVWSLIFWVRSTGLTTSDYRNILALDDTNSSHNYFYNVDTRQTINSYVLGYQKDYSINSWLTYAFNNSSQWDDETWWCLGVSHNNTVFKHYVQGVLTNTQTQTRDVAGYGDINQLFINRSNGNTVYMGPLLLYDRILSDDEFNQNYNAQKSRFGL